MNLFSALDQRSGLMHRMMARLGVDIERAAFVALGTQLSGAARTCAFCTRTKQCRAWLDRGAHGEGWQDFCPNAQRFVRLRSL